VIWANVATDLPADSAARLANLRARSGHLRQTLGRISREEFTRHRQNKVLDRLAANEIQVLQEWGALRQVSQDRGVALLNIFRIGADLKGKQGPCVLLGVALRWLSGVLGADDAVGVLVAELGVELAEESIKTLGGDVR
jgi:hypothetical protein